MQVSSNVDRSTIIEPTPDVASWQRPRTTEELMGFIARREAEVFKHVDSDLFA